jgi:hypothetical protein
MGTLISIGLAFYLIFRTEEKWKWVRKFMKWSGK